MEIYRAVVFLDRELGWNAIEERQERGIDQRDEVWNDVYLIMPLTDIQHSLILTHLVFAFMESLEGIPDAIVYGGVNVSDRSKKWKKNYRCPDVCVVMPGTTAVGREDYYLGGPDFLAEIVTPRDLSRKKLDFYAKVGTREVLIVDRKPWSLELYRLVDGSMKSAGKVEVGSSDLLISEVLPFTFALIPGEDRPTIEIIHTQDARRWLA